MKTKSTYTEKYNKFLNANFWKRTKEMEKKLENAINNLWK